MRLSISSICIVFTQSALHVIVNDLHVNVINQMLVENKCVDGTPKIICKSSYISLKKKSFLWFVVSQSCLSTFSI